MKTILYMTVSLDGKTTHLDDNVEWVTEADIAKMDSLMMECGVMLMGRGTYESFGDELPNDQALMVVMTSDETLLSKDQQNVLFLHESPVSVLSILSEKGFDQVLLAGGEQLNASFLVADLIDEIRLLVEPIVLGSGKSLFTQSAEIKKFSLAEVIQHQDDVVELVYLKK